MVEYLKMEAGKVKKIYAWEPRFFVFFGLFHLYRICGFFIALGAFVFCLGFVKS